MGKKTVAVSFLGACILVFGGHIVRGKLPTYRQIGGLFFAYLLLAVGSEFAPKPAGALSIVLLMTLALETAGDIGPVTNKILTTGSTVKEQVQKDRVQSIYDSPDLGRPITMHKEKTR